MRNRRAAEMLYHAYRWLLATRFDKLASPSLLRAAGIPPPTKKPPRFWDACECRCSRGISRSPAAARAVGNSPRSARKNAPACKGRKGCRGKKPWVSFPCAPANPNQRNPAKEANPNAPLPDKPPPPAARRRRLSLPALDSHATVLGPNLPRDTHATAPRRSARPLAVGARPNRDSAMLGAPLGTAQPTWKDFLDTLRPVPGRTDRGAEPRV